MAGAAGPRAMGRLRPHVGQGDVRRLHHGRPVHHRRRRSAPRGRLGDPRPVRRRRVRGQPGAGRQGLRLRSPARRRLLLRATRRAARCRTLTGQNRLMVSDKATTLIALHEGPGFVLPNAWDAGSARILEGVGFPAIATTSAGIAWSLGVPDGQGFDRDAMLERIASILAAVQVPVTADPEAGYGETAEAVA